MPGSHRRSGRSWTTSADGASSLGTRRTNKPGACTSRPLGRPSSPETSSSARRCRRREGDKIELPRRRPSLMLRSTSDFSSTHARSRLLPAQRAVTASPETRTTRARCKRASRLWKIAQEPLRTADQATARPPAEAATQNRPWRAKRDRSAQPTRAHGAAIPARARKQPVSRATR